MRAKLDRIINKKLLILDTLGEVIRELSNLSGISHAYMGKHTIHDTGKLKLIHFLRLKNIPKNIKWRRR